MSRLASIWIQNARLYSESGDDMTDEVENEAPDGRPGSPSAGVGSDGESKASKMGPAASSVKMVAVNPGQSVPPGTVGPECTAVVEVRQEE